MAFIKIYLLALAKQIENCRKILCINAVCKYLPNVVQNDQMSGNLVQVMYGTLHKKWSFPLRIFSINVTKSNPQFPTDLVKFTEEIFNGKLHFLSNGELLNFKLHFI